MVVEVVSAVVVGVVSIVRVIWTCCMRYLSPLVVNIYGLVTNVAIESCHCYRRGSISWLSNVIVGVLVDESLLSS